VTYTGKDIAYQLWKLGTLDLDFRYRRHRTYPTAVLWSMTSGPARWAPAFGHADAVYNVIDVGSPTRSAAGRGGGARLPRGRERSRHLGYERSSSPPPTRATWGTPCRMTIRR
jgi:arginyl-tRNA synthetase